MPCRSAPTTRTTRVFESVFVRPEPPSFVALEHREGDASSAIASRERSSHAHELWHWDDDWPVERWNLTSS